MAIDTVDVSGLSKRFGLHRALASVDLTLRGGQLCALLGHNGAGKSTLLGIISTLVRPSSGTVAFKSGDDEVADGAELRARIGVLAHHSFLYAGLDAVENVRFWARLYGLDVERERIEASLLDVGLDKSTWYRSTGTYSRGMVQRLALARTMIHDPDVLLLDEPFTGLDRGGARALAGALEKAVERERVVLVVTHDLESLSGIASHVAVLRRGRVSFEERRASFSFEELKDIYHQHGD